ncbi:hypothetical protein ES705_41339 [subsurface metagenome]
MPANRLPAYPDQYRKPGYCKGPVLPYNAKNDPQSFLQYHNSRCRPKYFLHHPVQYRAPDFPGNLAQQNTAQTFCSLILLFLPYPWQTRDYPRYPTGYPKHNHQANHWMNYIPVSAPNLNR